VTLPDEPVTIARPSIPTTSYRRSTAVSAPLGELLKVAAERVEARLEIRDAAPVGGDGCFVLTDAA